jgi:hypothetical protein
MYSSEKEGKTPYGIYEFNKELWVNALDNTKG